MQTLLVNKKIMEVIIEGKVKTVYAGDDADREILERLQPLAVQ